MHKMLYNLLFTGVFLALYIDNNDNKMTLFGNIVYLCPCSVIVLRAQAGNKQYSLTKSFYSLIYIINSYE